MGQMLHFLPSTSTYSSCDICFFSSLHDEECQFHAKHICLLLSHFFVSYTHQNVSGQIMYSIKGQSWNFDLAGQKISRNPRNLFKLTTSVILGHWTNGCYFAAIKRTSKMGLDILVLWWANHWEDKLDRSNRRQNCLQGY